MGLEILTSLFELAESVLRHEEVLSRVIDDEHQIEISSYFDAIGATVSGAVILIESGLTPDGNCEGLKYYVKKLPVVIGQYVGYEIAEEMKQKSLDVMSTNFQSSEVVEAGNIFKKLAKSVR